MVLAEAPTLRSAIERPMTVPREMEGLPQHLETILSIYWEKIRSEVVVPLLESNDLVVAMQEHWDAYERWAHIASDSLINMLGELTALAHAAGAELFLRNLNDDCGKELLGPEASKAFEASLHLRGLVRVSLTRLVEEREILETGNVDFGNLVFALTAHDLCATAVAEYLTTENTSYQANASSLAMWSFQYADMAYATWGVAEVDLGLVSPLKRE